MREKIILALMKLLRTRGLKFTMDDLVKDLHISKSTLYNHFKSREELLECMMDYILEKLDEKETEILKSNASLEEKLIATSSMYTQDYGIFQNQVYQYLYNIPRINEKLKAYNRQRFRHFNTLLDEGYDAGLVRTTIDRDVFFQLLLVAQRGLLDPNILGMLNLTYGDVIDECLHILLHGILKSDKELATENRN